MPPSSQPQRPLSKIGNVPRASGSNPEATTKTASLCTLCGTRTRAAGSAQYCQPCRMKVQMRDEGQPYGEIARVWMESTAEYEREREAEALRKLEEVFMNYKPEPVNDSLLGLQSKPDSTPKPKCAICGIILPDRSEVFCPPCTELEIKYGDSRWAVAQRKLLKKKAAAAKKEAEAAKAAPPSTVALGKRKADTMEAPPAAALPTRSCKGFQTRAAMYEELTTRMRNFYTANKSSQTGASYVAFHGAYSIVADPSVSHKLRSTLVSQELQKIVKLPHSSEGTPTSNSATSYAVAYPCECDMKVVPQVVPPMAPASVYAAPPTPTATPSSSSLTFIHAPHSSALDPMQVEPVLQLAPATPTPPAKKPKQSTLAKWILREGAKKAPVLQLAPPAVTLSSGLSPVAPAVAAYVEPIEEKVCVCGGTVRITVLADTTHTYFTGQRIEVEVSHPPRVS
ncbi:hypothetical protein PsYK624_070730 [Phanerochaete sordida]|uniref:Uncharacterized protein n=1 Tax=Phanerochaete sordida TaxID=48140 RepID=A0A9P3LCW8_9APHY|nr:hypothetical protein PsYK624_070730 [Phanerochaete sordida]